MACNVHEEKIKQSGTQEGKLKKTTSNPYWLSLTKCQANVELISVYFNVPVHNITGKLSHSCKDTKMASPI